MATAVNRGSALMFTVPKRQECLIIRLTKCGDGNCVLIYHGLKINDAGNELCLHYYVNNFS